MRLRIHPTIIIPLFLIGMADNLSCSEGPNTELNPHSFPLNSKAILYPVKDNIAYGKRTLINYRILKRKNAGLPQTLTIPHPARFVAEFKKKELPVPDTINPGTKHLFPTIKKVEEQAILINPSTSITAKLAEYKQPGPYSFASLDRQEGLKDDNIHCVLKDNRNQLWIGTSLGVICYDGHTFLNLNTEAGLCHNDIRAILKDKKGDLWFGTPAGISRYNGRSLVKYNETNGLSSPFVSALAEDKKGRVWIGTTDGGVNMYDGLNITHYKMVNGLISDSVNTLVCDESGKIWIGTNHGLSSFDGKKFINYTFDQQAYPDRIHALMPDDQNRLWIGSDKGLTILDGRNFYSLILCEELKNKKINALTEDGEHNIWIGSQDGLFKYDGKFMTLFGKAEGLQNTNITSLLNTESRILWIGTNGGGLLKFNPYSFSHLTKNEGLKKDFVQSIYEDQEGRLWLGTFHGGVNEIYGNKIKNYSMSQGLPANNVRGVVEDRHGNYWFATSDGVSKYNGKTFEHYRIEDGLADRNIPSIMQDSHGSIWIGTEHGASRIDNRSIMNFFFDSLQPSVYFIKEDRKKNIWFATSSGIFVYDRIGISQQGDSTGVLSGSFHHIFEDGNGDLWFASSNGLLKYDGYSIIRFTEKEGLISNEVSAVAGDDEGNLWIGTIFGVSKLSVKIQSILPSRIRQNRIKADDILFTNYDRFDGFSGTSVNDGALVLLSNRTIAAGTPQGLTIFNPDGGLPDTLAPPIQITELKIANQGVTWNLLDGKRDTSIQLAQAVQLHKFRFDSTTSWNHLPAGLSLPSDNNYLNIYFSGARPDDPQDVVYSYRLEGSNNRARTITRQPFAYYGNLAPRHYIFRVKAGSGNGIWSNEAEFSFTIRPPWWQTWWFKLILFSAFGYGVFFSTRMFFRLRMQKQKSLLEKELALYYERQRISADLHDDIGATLSSINIYSTLAQTEVNKQGYLDSIKKNVNEVIEKLDDLVWRINPRYDTLESVMNRLVFYAGPAAAARQINFNIEMQDEIKSVKLDSESKQHIFLIVKELLNNAIKHSNCKNLWLIMSSVNNRLAIIVKDDGSGLDPQRKDFQRNGLNNIRERANSLHAELKIQSSAGEGLLTSLIVPLASHKSGMNH